MNCIVQRVSEESIAPIILDIYDKHQAFTTIIVPTLTQAEVITVSLQTWAKELRLPLQIEYLPEAKLGAQYLPENESSRAAVLYQMAQGEVDIVVVTAAGLLTPVPNQDEIVKWELELKKGMEISIEQLVTQLTALDYDNEHNVTIAGDFAKRGGIIDIFSPIYDMPVRIEFWGDEIESMHLFSVETQRSTEEIECYTVIPRGNMLQEKSDGDFYDFLCFGNKKNIIMSFPDESDKHIQRFLSGEEQDRWKKIVNELEHSGKTTYLTKERLDNRGVPNGKMPGCFPALSHIQKQFSSSDDIDYDLLTGEIVSQIEQWAESGYHITFITAPDRDFKTLLEWQRKYVPNLKNFNFKKSLLKNGLIFPHYKFVFIAEKELFTGGIHHQNRPMQSYKKLSRHEFNETESGLKDLQEGDYVVHLLHGIGRFIEIREYDLQGVIQEAIVLEFADEMKIYVPMWQAHLITRYIGARNVTISLSKIGSKRWTNAKIRTTREIQKLAVEMLEVQAIRTENKGFSYSDDTYEQERFEKSFPFDETPDQLTAIEEIKQDMSNPKPMDRLLCGDVGYGKTEVAMRAAFKAVMEGKQVAILVPTTILAQQHFISFTERFAGYPIIIDVLSRFRTKKEQRHIVEQLAAGQVDIIIGTHRIVQNDIQFADLGLVIIDEEQRFGVKHKERFKSLRATVDVLTMTATPIPRTMYQAMSGLRNLSTITTAPTNRLPIKTVVTHYDEETIKRAILQEIEREGQVYFLHNRVKTIEGVAADLERLLPDVRFGVAHGQMHEHELEDIMSQFLQGDIDVLVCTTIIESGLDIPNANTIIIDRADRFGLAALYQLRGRVGRWSRQAFAYFLVPQQHILTTDAKKRIAAIRRYTHLGAGFRLAVRDLEIRGTGNLLGAEQSGYINTIGFELYCQILRDTAKAIKGEQERPLKDVDINIDFVKFGYKSDDPSVFLVGISPDYMESPMSRVTYYQRLLTLRDMTQFDAFSEELRDRFGKFTDELKQLLSFYRLKLLLALHDYDSLDVLDGRIYLKKRKQIVLDSDKSIPNIPEFIDGPSDMFAYVVRFCENTIALEKKK